MRGGLDLVSSPLTVEPGRLISGLNYVPSEAGYRRILGYERKDGRPAPSDAAYWMLGYDLGSGTKASVGDTITGPGAPAATAVVLAVTDDDYVLGELSGTMADGAALEVSGAGAGAAEGTPRRLGAATIADDLSYRHLAAAHRRSAIQKVPGTGPVRGVWQYKNDLYAIRDVTPVSGEPVDAKMFKATEDAGWSEVNLGHKVNFDGGTAEPSAGDRISVAGGSPTYPTSERFSRGSVSLAATKAGRTALDARCVAVNSQSYTAETRITTNIGNLPNADDYIIRQRYLLKLSKKWNRITLTSASAIDDAAYFYILGSDRYGALDASRYIVGVGQEAYTGSNASLNATVDPDADGWGAADEDGFWWVVLEFYFIEISGGQACNVRLGWRNADASTQDAAVVNAASNGIEITSAAVRPVLVATLSDYTLTSGSWASDDAAGELYLRIESGVIGDNDVLKRGEAGSATNFAVVNGAATAMKLPAGGSYSFVNHNFKGQAKTETMFGTHGMGFAFSYDGIALREIPTGHDDDRPTYLAVHRQHLLLAYPGGSLIVSETANPYGYTAAKGAAEIATGQDINGLAEGVGIGNTLIMGAERIQILYGADQDNFELADHSDRQTGGVENTLQLVGGPLYMDNRGVRSVTTTEAYGNFVIGTMTAAIQPWIDLQREERNAAAGSLRVRSNDQYFLWFESGVGICIYLGRGRPEIGFVDFGSNLEAELGFDAGEREPMFGEILTGATSGARARIDYATVESGTWAGDDAAGTLRLVDATGTFQNNEYLEVGGSRVARVDGAITPAGVKVLPRCTVSAEDSDRIERVYFGADDGFVYEAERGRSFDGDPISAYARLPLNHTGAPTQQKRWHACDLHLDVASRIRLEVSALYDDGTNPEQLLVDQTIYGGGGLWEEGFWEEFYYDSPINGFATYDLFGLGRNVSILMRSVTDREPPHTLNGMSLRWSDRRRER